MKQHQSALCRLTRLVKKEKKKKLFSSAHLPLPTSNRHLLQQNKNKHNLQVHVFPQRHSSMSKKILFYSAS
jgi:hypothetical protein